MFRVCGLKLKMLSVLIFGGVVVRLFLCLLVCFALPAFSAQSLSPFAQGAQSLTQFINAQAFDESRGVFFTDLDSTGSPVSEKLDMEVLSLFVFATAEAARWDELSRQRAVRSGDFMLRNLLKVDDVGYYFARYLDEEGRVVPGQKVITLQDQALALSSAVSLFQMSRVPFLLDAIREIYSSFYTRFHDDKGRGFFSQYTQRVPTRGNKGWLANLSAGILLLKLREVDSRPKTNYEKALKETADIVRDFAVDHLATPDTVGKYPERHFLMAWYLLKIATENIGKKWDVLDYRKVASKLFETLNQQLRQGSKFEALKFGTVFEIYEALQTLLLIENLNWSPFRSLTENHYLQRFKQMSLDTRGTSTALVTALDSILPSSKRGLVEAAWNRCRRLVGF